MKQMIQRKNDVVDQTCKGVEFLMKKNKIDVYNGIGSFVDKNTISIAGKEGEKNIQGKYIAVSYTHLRAHETVLDLVCRLLLEKKKYQPKQT